MNLAAFLVAMVGPLVVRLLAALGVSLITMTGATVAFDAVKNQVLGAASGLPLAAIQLAGLVGVWAAIGMLIGAYSFAMTWASTKGFMALAKA
jgi:hypothetical protein